MLLAYGKWHLLMTSGEQLLLSQQAKQCYLDAAFHVVQRTFQLDSHPYSYETTIFTIGAPHEEVQGRQTKLHQGFTLGELVQPSPGISFLWDSHIVLSKQF